MNQALRERFYSQGNKKHIDYVVRVSGMGEQEAAIPYVNEKMPIQIPVVGITLKIGKQELDALYKYIKEA